jgi:hypothetical protein
MLILYAFSPPPQFTLLHTFLKLNTYLDTFRIGIYGWVELLSPVVLSVVQSSIFKMLSMSYVLV